AIRKFPAPVIARIKGYCLGAGLEIAISCDLRIASDDSVFGMPEVKVGIPSVIEAALLPRLVGSGRARQLVLTGEPISAPEALAWGLVEQVAPAENLDAAVDQWIRPILDAGAQAVRIQKALIRDWESLPLEQSVERGIDAFSRAYETEEPASLMQKFLRRRDNR
ncbi:MAG TPA: enoyl-CoA hydratase-related protein, partial [Blastocatellia bacterium]|nr:enoyl-CoA hydratase-related protein [Blastocatellia bacterium]